MATIPEALAIAVQHHQAGRLQAAEQLYRQILAVEPNQADAIHLLGVLAHQAGKHQAAVEIIARAIALKGNVAGFHNNLGNALKELRKLDEAATSYGRALALDPNHADAAYNLGNALKDQGKLDEAVAAYRRALGLKPEYAEAHNNLGNALKELGKLDEAVVGFRRALELKPDYAEACNNLGNALKEQGKLEEAAARFRRALELRPDFAEAHYNLGGVFHEQGDLGQAIAACQRALELKPDHAEAHSNRALSWLLGGNFAQGWPEYEWRRQLKNCPQRDFPQPQWDGQPLQDRTILLHAEQGLGDTLQFIRYVPWLRERHPRARFVVECQKPLLRLFAGIPAIDQLIGQGEELPTFDVQAPLMSLPLLCKTTLENVPAEVPYVHAVPALVAQWRERLSRLNGLRVGICWQGNPQNRGDRFRSIPLRCFALLGQVGGIAWISLQKGHGLEQMIEVRDAFPVVDWGEEMDEQAGPFMDTAAVVANLDLVIAADTAIAHLAGAMGVPVWVALSSAPDWRWLLERSDSPWYPGMRLFRQKSRGDWTAVFEEIKLALGEKLEPHDVQIESRDPAGNGRRVAIEVSAGELIDKITILEIKAEHFQNPEKLGRVRLELEMLRKVRNQMIPSSPELTELADQLGSINRELWQIEDALRSCEQENDFGPRFVGLARSVYRNNDRRCDLKRRINELTGSLLREEKSYTPYR